MRQSLALSLLLLLTSPTIVAKEDKSKTAGGSAQPSSIEVISYRPMRPNSVEAWFVNDARSFQTQLDGAGFFWPAGSGRAAIFLAAPWVAAQFEGDTTFAGIRTAAVENLGRNGTEYRPGKILRVGNSIVADDPNLPRYRLYHIRRGDDALVNPDYAEWPVADGAPVNANGQPLVTGSESMWYVANDMVPGARRFSAQPLGCELQQYMYGIPSSSPILNQTIFIKMRLINRNIPDPQNPNRGLWKNAYIAMFNDANVGDAGDDLVGCDTLNGLAYTYNATNNDIVYGPAPPAVGFVFLEGRVRSTPIAPSAHVRFGNAGGPISLPTTGYPNHVYNLMRGLDKNGNPLSHTVPGSRFMFPGDPATGQGIIETQLGDKLSLLAAGPFDVRAGDTVEVTYAVVIARGASNLNSVTLLRQYASLIRSFYNATNASPYRIALYLNRGVNPTVNTPFEIAIETQDSLGFARPVTQNTVINLSLTAGSGTLSGTQTAIVLAGQSQAVIDNLAYNQAENGVQITASRVSGNNLVPGTIRFNVRPAATALAVQSLSFPPSSSPATVFRDIRIAAILPDSSLDSNYSRPVSLSVVSGPTNLAGQTTVLPINGVATFNVAFPRAGTYTLRASSANLPPLNVGTFAVIPLLANTPPQYAKIPASAEPSILPHCRLFQIAGLTPNATYRYRFVTTASSNFIAPSPNGFVRHQPPYPNDLSQKFGEFTTDANGFYRGWFIAEMIASGNLAGSVQINDGANGSQIAYNISLTEPISTNFFGTTALRATGVVGILPATIGSISTARKIVALYDNVQGTGRPLSTTYTEDDGTAPTDYPSFYQTSVNGVNGRFGTLLLNQSPNGIRRLELLDLNGNRLAFATSANGVWGTVNTVNPSGGATQPLVIDFSNFLSAPAGNESKPNVYRLAQNYPNPFNPTTVIAYQLPVASDVKLEVFDVLGRKVATLVDAKQAAGEYSVSFNAEGLASGVYFYRLQAKDFVQTKKMMLVR
ncbi:MAG: T9SS type A sorting domain-containing protein [Chloroherpetonaceae bacterium]|nr:T9SS type A sorting domain-containing protein [Chloroherpetonaceae bacterium]MDW8437195.1 T9SS type A sorting domain-containing protein [Chloroherpetonaceae bacterium]